jgi:hypothetical protein
MADAAVGDAKLESTLFVNLLNMKRIIVWVSAISPYRAVNAFHHGYKSALYKQSVCTAL